MTVHSTRRGCGDSALNPPARQAALSELTARGVALLAHPCPSRKREGDSSSPEPLGFAPRGRRSLVLPSRLREGLGVGQSRDLSGQLLTAPPTD